MRNVFTVLATVFLLTSIGAAAQTVEQSLYLCRTDLLKYVEGDKTWLDRQLAVSTLSEAQKANVKTVCRIYAEGLKDGLEIAKPEPKLKRI